jgi:4-hydroxyphenylpyruvate dioxygenase-like putative hemolysin
VLVLLPAVAGLFGGTGGAAVARPGEIGSISISDVDFEPIVGAPQHPEGDGLAYVDHLTHNVPIGGDAGGLLLQIFSENPFGPVFFEIIRRKGNDGFGEGNFRPPFESMELDWIRGGVVRTD